MRFGRHFLFQVLFPLALAAMALRADSGDVENSSDYAGFPRPPGFVITDYDEDNPAEFDFPVARPLPIDAARLETVRAKGHRYVIRYELDPAHRAPGLFQTQQYYEKLAAKAGFKIEKNGAVGAVTETFHRAGPGREIWVYLEPAITANVLTIVESNGRVPIPAPPHAVASAPAAPPPKTESTPPPPSVHESEAPALTAVPAPPINPDDDSLYAALNESGRVTLPFIFQPGRDDLDTSAQPLIGRIVAMMKLHPDLFLRIEGHTDNVGDPEANLRLSAQRALAVQALLVTAHIDGKRLDAVGVGGLQPLADNNTAGGREKNRRIELVMWKKYSTFHASAPNGQNYYPANGSSPAAAKPGF